MTTLNNNLMMSTPLISLKLKRSLGDTIIGKLFDGLKKLNPLADGTNTVEPTLPAGGNGDNKNDNNDDDEEKPLKTKKPRRQRVVITEKDRELGINTREEKIEYIKNEEERRRQQKEEKERILEERKKEREEKKRERREKKDKKDKLLEERKDKRAARRAEIEKDREGIAQRKAAREAKKIKDANDKANRLAEKEAKDKEKAKEAKIKADKKAARIAEAEKKAEDARLKEEQDIKDGKAPKKPRKPRMTKAMKEAKAAQDAADAAEAAAKDKSDTDTDENPRKAETVLASMSSAMTTFYGYTFGGFHLVTPSPWPILTAFSTFSLLVAVTSFMHSYMHSSPFLFFGLFILMVNMSSWFRDMSREGTFEGKHTTMVQIGLRIGMILFIISEIMFFFAFFWAFFHSSLAPAIMLGGIWPPLGIITFDPYAIPLLNTIILVSSGVTVTWTHHALAASDHVGALDGFLMTVGLALVFTGLQYYEYAHAPFTISDGIYGSCFYMATGFHGFHVIVGTIFLTVCLYRTARHHFTAQHHYGFEAAAWYFHFVDVVWIFLYMTIYVWGA